MHILGVWSDDSSRLALRYIDLLDYSVGVRRLVRLQGGIACFELYQGIVTCVDLCTHRSCKCICANDGGN
jgi:hypothetical protein